jgi:hypothetical protein
MVLALYWNAYNWLSWACAKFRNELSTRPMGASNRWRTAITAARVETTGKDNAGKNSAHPAAGIAAREELATIITKSRGMGFVGIELDARLALAQIEMKTGQISAGDAHLAAIETDAKIKGYNLIARKAAHARG